MHNDILISIKVRRPCKRFRVRGSGLKPAVQRRPGQILGARVHSVGRGMTAELLNSQIYIKAINLNKHCKMYKHIKYSIMYIGRSDKYTIYCYSYVQLCCTRTIIHALVGTIIIKYKYSFKKYYHNGFISTVVGGKRSTTVSVCSWLFYRRLQIVRSLFN